MDNFRSRHSSTAPGGRAGFTLVEVAIALGIVSCCFVTLLALLPAGENTYRRAMDVTICSQIAQKLLNEAYETDFSTLIDEPHATGVDDPGFTFRAPLRTDPAIRHFDDQGREIIPAGGGHLTPTQLHRVVYQANTRILTNAQLPRETGDNGVAVQPLAQVTVQVAHNPSGRDIPFGSTASTGSNPLRNLWVPSTELAGVEIYTTSALVGRSR